MSKTVPLKKMPQDILMDPKWWYVESDTAEAVMEYQNEKELLRVYDAMHLVNLSKSDIQKLFFLKIFFREDWREEAMKYQRVIDVCDKKGMHAGSSLLD